MLKENEQYYSESKMPVKVVSVKEKVRAVKVKHATFVKIMFFIFAIIAFVASAMMLAAFEAHVINVTAHICNYGQTRTIGFWKNHPQAYQSVLPQFLGDNPSDYIVDSTQNANSIFVGANAKDMRVMLKAQLLAMKFNIAVFGIGDYFVDSEGKTLNQIVAYADDLLRDPTSTRDEQERIKTLLNDINNLHQLRFCAVIDPAITSLLNDKGHMVINEVYYDPDSKHCSQQSKEWQNEWIELYNPTENPVSLTNWQIGDNSNNWETILTFPPIPAYGFAVITPKASTKDIYWSVPTEKTVIIETGNKIGNGLDNDGDRVILKDASGNVVDSVSWGTDTSAFNPSVPVVAEGHSISRCPLGFDTDQASDWIDLENPTPGWDSTELGSCGASGELTVPGIQSIQTVSTPLDGVTQ
jgi:hypothetical protein